MGRCPDGGSPRESDQRRSPGPARGRWRRAASGQVRSPGVSPQSLGLDSWAGLRKWRVFRGRDRLELGDRRPPLDEQAAIYLKELSGGIGCVVSGEKESGPGDVGGKSLSPKRDDAPPPRLL